MAQIEELVCVERARGVSVRTLNIVGEDFELRFSEDFGALFQQQRVVLHGGIGLLAGIARHDELALKNAATAIEHRALVTCRVMQAGAPWRTWLVRSQ